MNGQTKMEKLLLQAGRELASTLDYEELMKMILELTAKATGAEAAMVHRIDKHMDEVRGRFCQCADATVKYFKMDKGRGVLGWVAENQEPLIVNDLEADRRYSPEIEKFTGMNLKSAMAVPLIGRGQMIGVVEAVNKLEGDFTQADLDALVGLASQFAVAIDNANLYRTAKRRAVEQQLLYDVSKTLSSTLNIDEVLKQILGSLRRVVGFDAGGVFLVKEEKGEIVPAYSEGYEPEYEPRLPLKVGQGLVGWVANAGEAVIVPDVAQDDRYVSAHPETRSEIVAPVKIDGRVLGVVNLESNQPDAYDQNSLELINAFASHAAISIERAYLHGKRLESKRLEEQLAIARQIQATFLPDSHPVIEGYDISGVNIPSEEVGGDYFDFIKIVDYQTGIAIADVSGKGIPASLIMASFRASLLAEIRNNYAIRTICKKVNSLLYESVERGNYVTAFYGVLDSKNNILTFSNCGHNRPIFLRSDGSIEFLKEGGIALAVTPNSEYDEHAVFLQKGDTVVFYTDGVTEVNDSDGREFGQDGLIKALKQHHQLPAQELQQRLIDEVKNHACRDHVFDDLTIIILKRT